MDHRKNLRERVSRLEALVDSLLEDKSERSTSDRDTSSLFSKPPTVVNKDNFPTTPLSSEASSSILREAQRAPSDRGHHVPILSVFEDAVSLCNSITLCYMTDCHSLMMLKSASRLAWNLYASLPTQLQPPRSVTH